MESLHVWRGRKLVEYSTIFLKIVTMKYCFTMEKERREKRNNGEKREEQGAGGFHHSKREMAHIFPFLP